MSEHFGEAGIFIRPDLTGFRAELIAGLEKATAGVTVPVPVLAAGTGTRTAKAASASVVASHKAAGQAAAEAAAQTIGLDRATVLATAAQEQLAAVEKAGEFATTDLAAAKAKLAAAEKAVAAAQKAHTAALETQSNVLAANSSATLAAAEAAAVLARETTLEGVAHARTARSEAAHAASHHALTKGAAATGLSLVGARGATLAASSAFLAGAAAVTIFEHAVHEASAETEAAARVDRVFGDSADELEKHAKGLAQSFGLSARQALDFEGKIGNTFKVVGIGGEEAAHTSEAVTKLAADMAAFANVPVDKVLKAIQLGLVGNTRGLRLYQVQLNQSIVAQEALTETGKKHVEQLTAQEKEQAFLTLLFQQTTNQQGAAARRADGLAQSEKVLKAELENLGGTLGRAVIPKITELVKETGFAIHAFGLFGDTVEKLASKAGGSQFGHFVKDVQTLFSPTSGPLAKFKVLKEGFKIVFPDDANRKIELLDKDGKKLSLTWEELHARSVKAFETKELAAFADSLKGVIFQAQHLVVVLERRAFTAAANQLATLKDQLVGIKVAGGGAGEILANLDKQEAAARRALAAAEAEVASTHGRSIAAVEKERSARLDLLDVLDQEKAKRQEIADGAQQAAEQIAAAVQAAIDKAKELIQQADEATLASFEPRQGQIDLAAAKAQGTKSLVDDLAVERSNQKFIEQQIKIVSTSIIDEKVREAKLRELRVARQNSINAQKALNDQIAQNAKDRKAAAIANQGASIDADIEFAQITKNKSAEIKAHLAKIKFINIQIAHAKRGTLEWKKLRNERAQEQAAVKALRHQDDKLKQDLQAMQFEFLQRQSGFVSNLLSNILPSATLAGTVGGSSISTPTSVGTGNRQRASFEQGLHTASQTGGGQRGATAGQLGTLITISRHQLQILMRLVGQRQHPEATNQRIMSAADIDIWQW